MPDLLFYGFDQRQSESASSLSCFTYGATSVFCLFNIRGFRAYRKIMIRKYQRLAIMLSFAPFLIAAVEEELFNGKDTSGWKLVDPARVECWKVVSTVSLDPNDPKKL